MLALSYSSRPAVGCGVADRTQVRATTMACSINFMSRPTQPVRSAESSLSEEFLRPLLVEHLYRRQQVP